MSITGRTARHVFAAIAIVALLCGCGPTLGTQFRKDGMALVTRGWQAIDEAPETASLDVTVTLERVRVRIVGRKNPSMLRLSPHCAGFATSGNDITLLGKIVALPDGTRRIVLDQAVLGHETNHLLHWAYPAVADPDRMEEAGF